MRKGFLRALTLAGAAGFAACATTAHAASACDRNCLEGFIGKYFDAALAHDPHRLPLARNVKFTENGQTLELGDGLWRTLSAKGKYQMIVSDVAAGHVAFLGSIEEADTPAMLALHLKVKSGRIEQIETLVQRNDKSAAGFDKIGYRWTDPIPTDERASRAELMRVANLYFSGLERNDGKGDYPFTDDCNRIENGTNTTNVPTLPGQTRPDPKSSSNYSAQWSCMEQFKSGLLHFVSRIRDRRYVAMDPERGLVFIFAFFDHSAGDTRTFQTPDGRTVTAGPKQPWTWEIAETFRLEHGKIRQIMAIMERVPYGMNSGWSSWADGLSSRARDATE